jgi:large subunit ribosomal protein L15e
MSATKRIHEEFMKSYSGEADFQKQRLIAWRKEGSQVTVEKPTNPVRARALGYKAKQGVVVVRVSVRKGNGTRTRPSKARKPSKAGINQIKRTKSEQSIGEERVARKHPNMEVLNSYWVGEDGQSKWFEVIMIDPAHPSVHNDADFVRVLTDTRRVFRGKTSAGKKSKAKPVK